MSWSPTRDVLFLPQTILIVPRTTRQYLKNSTVAPAWLAFCVLNFATKIYHKSKYPKPRFGKCHIPVP